MNQSKSTTEKTSNEQKQKERRESTSTISKDLISGIDLGKEESDELVDSKQEEKVEEEVEGRGKKSGKSQDSTTTLKNSKNSKKRKTSTHKARSRIQSTDDIKSLSGPTNGTASTPPDSQAKEQIPLLLPLPPTTTTEMSSKIPQATPLIRLLVCSIGNPAPYTNTLHSAGHTILTKLQSSHPSTYTPFEKSRAYANGLLSQSFDPSNRITLYQSPSLMNVSGPPIIKAYREFLNEEVDASEGEEGMLVVVHDELELGLGEVKLKKGALSVKGHNGLKSIRERMGIVGLGIDGKGLIGKFTKGKVEVRDGKGTVKRPLSRGWVRIGVGIGRPESRERDVVAEYVLRKMSLGERRRIEGAVGGVVELLEVLRSGLGVRSTGEVGWLGG